MAVTTEPATFENQAELVRTPATLEPHDLRPPLRARVRRCAPVAAPMTAIRSASG